MTAATYTRVEVAEKLGVSESRVRQLLAIVSERIEGATVENRITEAGLNAITTYRELGRSAWLAANPIAQPQPITPVAPQPQPQPIAQPIAQPATVVDVATAPAPGRPQLVWVNPVQPQAEPAPIATYEPVPVVGLSVPGSVMLATHCQVENLIQATDAMLDAIDQRFSVGEATIDAQRDATARRIEELRDKKTAINARARLYRSTQIEASVVAQHNAQTVGKLQSEVMADGQALGFQLSVQSC